MIARLLEEQRRPLHILRIVTYNPARDPANKDYDQGWERLDGKGTPRPYPVPGARRPAPAVQSAIPIG